MKKTILILLTAILWISAACEDSDTPEGMATYVYSITKQTDETLDESRDNTLHDWLDNRIQALSAYSFSEEVKYQSATPEKALIPNDIAAAAKGALGDAAIRQLKTDFDAWIAAHPDYDNGQAVNTVLQYIIYRPSFDSNSSNIAKMVYQSDAILFRYNPAQKPK